MQESPPTLAPIPAPHLQPQGVFENAQLFEHACRVASCLSSSTMVPERYRGEANEGNCVIAIDIAWRLGMPPLMVMQHLYVVYGTPSWSGQMITALVNGSKLFRDPLAFEFKGKKGEDEWGCRCYAVLKSTGERVDGPWVDIAMAKAEGWWDRKDKEGRFCSKWRTIPEMMMRYRAAAYFGRTVCPEVTIGLRTREEEEEIGTETLSGPFVDLPTLEMPALGETETTATETKPLPAANPTPVKVRRKKEAEAKAAAAAPAPEPPAPAVAEPAGLDRNPFAQEGDVENGKTPQSEPEPEPEPETVSPHVFLATMLNERGVVVDDFFDWVENTGRAHKYQVVMEKIQSINDLPMNFIVDLLADNKGLAGLFKTFGKKT